MTDEDWQPPRVLLTVDLVILTLRDSGLEVLLVERGVDLGASPRAIICWGRLSKVWAVAVEECDQRTTTAA